MDCQKRISKDTRDSRYQKLRRLFPSEKVNYASLSIGGAGLLCVPFPEEDLGKNGFVANSYDDPLLALDFKAHSCLMLGCSSLMVLLYTEMRRV